MPQVHVLCHITDALSLVAGSGVCVYVCLCLLNHVVVSHEDYRVFSDVLQPHILIFTLSRNPSSIFWHYG